MVITRTTRNRLIGDEPVRGFESHRLRHTAVNAMSFAAVFSIRFTKKQESYGTPAKRIPPDYSTSQHKAHAEPAVLLLEVTDRSVLFAEGRDRLDPYAVPLLL